MRYFYALNIVELMPTESDDDITNYINETGMKCFSHDLVNNLATKIQQPLCDTFRQVFIQFLTIEHKIRRAICHGLPEQKTNLKPYINQNINPAYYSQLSSFEKDYLAKIIRCNNSRSDILDICNTIDILHTEDSEFLFGSYKWLRNGTHIRDKFLTQQEKTPTKSNHHHVIILLNDTYEYVGHIYTWSWLAFATFNGHLDTLKFGSIRTSILNLLCKTDRSIAISMVQAVKQFALQYGWRALQVAFRPIGPMPGYLAACGFNSTNFIKISDMICQDHNVQQIDINCNIYPEKDFETWYKDKLSHNLSLFEFLWFDRETVSRIHKLLLRSYPDRSPTISDIEGVLKIMAESDIDYAIYLNKIRTLGEYCIILDKINKFLGGPIKKNLTNQLLENDIRALFDHESKIRINQIDKIVFDIESLYVPNTSDFEIIDSKIIIPSFVSSSLNKYIDLETNIKFIAKWYEYVLCSFKHKEDLSYIEPFNTYYKNMLSQYKYYYDIYHESIYILIDILKLSDDHRLTNFLETL